MNCPKCKNEEKCKSGFKNGNQRYLCKKCGCNYTRSFGRGYHPRIREKAIAYYLEGCGFRRIERMLGMSHNSVINWVKQATKVVQKISENYQDKENADILELDEMCTMVKKNETKSGYGLLWKEPHKILRAFTLEAAKLQVSSNFRKRLKTSTQKFMQQMIGNHTIA